MRRMAIYAIFFPPIVWLFMCAVNRVSPVLGSWFGLFSSLAVAYVFCIVPALLTAFVHNVFSERGVRSIYSMFVAAIATPLMFTPFIDGYREAWAYAVAGSFGAICCWMISRIGPKSIVAQSAR